MTVLADGLWSTIYRTVRPRAAGKRARQRKNHDCLYPPGLREVAEQPWREEPACDRQRKQPVVEAGVVIGKAMRDLLHHQRIDGCKAGADKENAHQRAKKIVSGCEHKHAK